MKDDTLLHATRAVCSADEVAVAEAQEVEGKGETRLHG